MSLFVTKSLVIEHWQLIARMEFLNNTYKREQHDEHHVTRSNNRKQHNNDAPVASIVTVRTTPPDEPSRDIARDNAIKRKNASHTKYNVAGAQEAHIPFTTKASHSAAFMPGL